MTLASYIAAALGAIALMLSMPRNGRDARPWGLLLIPVSLGLVWAVVGDSLLGQLRTGQAEMVYYYIFSALAVVAGCRVITHGRAVYSALWFMVVVLATCGLVLVLGAPFMAAAIAIIYGGAILVTYVFVIMLAQDAAGHADGDDSRYNLRSREPIVATAVAFILLGTISTMAFGAVARNPRASDPDDAVVISRVLTNRAAAQVADQFDGDVPLPGSVADPQSLDHVERVGLNLFEQHPLGVELAGVILLVALIGAIALSRLTVQPEPTTDEAC